MKNLMKSRIWAGNGEGNTHAVVIEDFPFCCGLTIMEVRSLDSAICVIGDSTDDDLMPPSMILNSGMFLKEKLIILELIRDSVLDKKKASIIFSDIIYEDSDIDDEACSTLYIQRLLSSISKPIRAGVNPRTLNELQLWVVEIQRLEQEIKKLETKIKNEKPVKKAVKKSPRKTK